MIKNKATYFILLLIIVFTGCVKTSEKYPLERWDEDVVFDPTDSAGINARAFLANIYSGLPNHYAGVNNSTILSEIGTDDAAYRFLNSAPENMINGRWSAWNLPDNVWNANYAGIRKVNLFLNKIDIVPIKEKGLISRMKGEARFLRAMFYFELVKRWGGVPLIGDRVLEMNEDLKLSKNSYEDCVNYIVSECDAIKNMVFLEKTPVTGEPLPGGMPDGEWGRVSRTAVMALKSRTLLYAASVLNNPANDINKWRAAATAAKDIIDINYHTLLTDFTGLFITRRTNETIFSFQTATSITMENNYSPIGYSPANVVNRGIINPSQNLVDAFPMKNGKDITEAGSGYDAQNPYNNRDPRLDATVFRNNTAWLGRPAAIYEGGVDLGKDGSRTGYYLKKFLGKFSTGTTYAAQHHSPIIFRYAEILLNYAEALNEVNNGPNAEAFNALDLIRQRAGLVPYQVDRSLGYAAFKKLVQNERRIELAFEGHRIWDIRRWNIGSTLNGQPLKGIRIVKNADNSFSYFYDVTVLNMVYTEKMNRYPIPIAEIEKNNNLSQNPGWD